MVPTVYAVSAKTSGSLCGGGAVGQIPDCPGPSDEDALKLLCKSRSALTHDADIFVKF